MFRRTSSESPLSTSVLLQEDPEPTSAAENVANALLAKLGGRSASFVLFFAKGYGMRSAPIGPLLQQKFGNECVVVGSNSEGGLIGDGQEMQNGTFALSALALASPSCLTYPFHTNDLGQVPDLHRGGTWSSVVKGGAPSCTLAFCTMPIHGSNSDPQRWLGLLDRALCPADLKSTLPVIVGGLTVGSNVYVDGDVHPNGGFGVVLQSSRNGNSQPIKGGATFDAVVSQGGVPFGPWLKITGVDADHIITSLDGRNPRDVLEPILASPSVPGTGNVMAGVFVNPTPVDQLPSLPSASAAMQNAALQGRPTCLLRPMHAFTEEGYLILTPLTESVPYEAGMQLQLHCFNASFALDELRSRITHDMEVHGGRVPDAAVVVQCGARGAALHGEMGTESRLLEDIWGHRVPTVGFFAGGEIGPVGLKTYMHGFTTSILLIRV